MTRWIVPTVLGAAGFAAWTLAQPRSEVELASYHTTLKGRTSAQRHNALLAVQKLNGAVIPAGATFSFNERVGSFSRDAGYRRAPVSYNGQLIDAWGGGVCQTSSTLYNAALLSGLNVVERHRHRFAPNYVPVGRDAAVAFPRFDLKIHNPHPFGLVVNASIVEDRLEVTFQGARPLGEAPVVVQVIEGKTPARAYRLAGPSRRWRNEGKNGYQVSIYRVTGARREWVSSDTYPAMARID